MKGADDLRYGGIGGMSEALGWTDVQREKSAGFMGGSFGPIKVVRLLLQCTDSRTCLHWVLQSCVDTNRSVCEAFGWTNMLRTATASLWLVYRPGVSMLSPSCQQPGSLALEAVRQKRTCYEALSFCTVRARAGWSPKIHIGCRQLWC